MPHSELIVKGKAWPSVSELVSLLDKPGIRYWVGLVGNEEAGKILKDTAKLGQTVHAAIEEFLTTGSFSSCGDKEVQKLFDVWFKWWGESGYKCTVLEKKVISKKYKYHGTLDAILFTHKDYLTDWKISNSDDWFRVLQLAGYAQAYYEETGNKINNGLIVRVGKKDLKVHETHVTDLFKYVPYFLLLRKLYDFIKKAKKWMHK